MNSSIAVGMIGYKFMGKAHSNAYRQINQFFDLPLKPRLRTICGREQSKVEKMAARWGWENAVTDWRAIIDDPEIRVVDICSPNNTHHDIAIAAFEAGKIVACEKPLAMNGAEATRMAAAARKSGQINTLPARASPATCIPTSSTFRTTCAAISPRWRAPAPFSWASASGPRAAAP